MKNLYPQKDDLGGFAPEKPLPPVYLIPASLLYPLYGGFGAYVKWQGHGKSHGTEVLSVTPWNVHFRTADREVYLVGKLNKTNVFEGGVSMTDWDEFVPFSLFHELATSDGKGPNFFMVNAHSSKQYKGRTHRTRIERDSDRYKKFIMGDSGGFQLRTVNGFINPHEVAEFYNENVDFGVVLDFPLWDPTHWPNLEGAARIQKANTDAMFETLRPEVELVNVAHGISPKHRLKFLEIVHDMRIQKVSISKSYFGEGVISFVNGIYKFWKGLNKKWPGHYKHLHILGLSENRLALPIMRMAAQGLFGDTLITFDSTSHIQTAKMKGYFSHSHGLENSKVLYLGDDKNLPNPMQTLPCSCPMCSVLGYQDAYTLGGTGVLGIFPLMYHNIYAMDAYWRQLLWFATNLQLEELVSMISKVFSNNSNHLMEIENAVRFVDEIKENGYKEARRRFRYYIDYASEDDEESGMAVDLFGNLAETQSADYYEDEGGYSEDDEPNNIIDTRRISKYLERVQGMQFKDRIKEEEGRDKRNKKKQRKVKRKTAPEERFEKKITNIKARSGPDLAKVKNRASKSSRKPTKEEREAKISHSITGKQIRKTDSKRRARL